MINRRKTVYKKRTLMKNAETHQKTIELSKLPRYLAKRDDKIIFKTSNIYNVCPREKITREISNSRTQFTKAMIFLMKNDFIIVKGYKFSLYKTTIPFKYLSERIK